MATTYEVARCDNDTAGDWVGGFWEEVEVDNANTTITFQDGKKLPFNSIKSKFIRKIPTTQQRWERKIISTNAKYLYYLPNDFFCFVCGTFQLEDCLAITTESISNYETTSNTPPPYNVIPYPIKLSCCNTVICKECILDPFASRRIQINKSFYCPNDMDGSNGCNKITKDKKSNKITSRIWNQMNEYRMITRTDRNDDTLSIIDLSIQLEMLQFSKHIASEVYAETGGFIINEAFVSDHIRKFGDESDRAFLAARASSSSSSSKSDISEWHEKSQLKAIEQSKTDNTFNLVASVRDAEANEASKLLIAKIQQEEKDRQIQIDKDHAQAKLLVNQGKSNTTTSTSSSSSSSTSYVSSSSSSSVKQHIETGEDGTINRFYKNCHVKAKYRGQWFDGVVLDLVDSGVKILFTVDGGKVLYKYGKELYDNVKPVNSTTSISSSKRKTNDDVEKSTKESAVHANHKRAKTNDQPNDELVLQLQGVGGGTWSADACFGALKRSGGDITSAVETLYNIYMETEDEEMREILNAGIRDLESERRLRSSTGSSSQGRL